MNSVDTATRERKTKDLCGKLARAKIEYFIVGRLGSCETWTRENHSTLSSNRFIAPIPSTSYGTQGTESVKQWVKRKVAENGNKRGLPTGI